MTVIVGTYLKGAQANARRGNKALFFLVCLYWLSQAFLVPLFPAGPSWALWPTFSDLIILAMLPLAIYRCRFKALPKNVRSVISGSLVLFGVCLLSFLFAKWLYGSDASESAYGFYQLLRLFQFIIVSIATACMAISPQRTALLARMSLLVFCLIAGGVLLVASGAINTSYANPLLLPFVGAAGPWASYLKGMGQTMGSGFIGYNHSYVAMQLILSGGFAYQSYEYSRRLRLLIFTLLSLSVFATGSRGGFIAAIVLIVLCELRQKRSNLFFLFVTFAICGIWALDTSGSEDILERQTSAATSLSDDGMSGRTDIWQEHLQYFQSHPLNLVVGTGFGFAAKASESNAHMLYLHVLTEAGMIGLIVFLYTQFKTIAALSHARFKVMRFTVYTLLFAGMTHESLYPVAAFNQFLGFYFSALILTLRTAQALYPVQRPEQITNKQKSTPAQQALCRPA